MRRLCCTSIFALSILLTPMAMLVPASTAAGQAATVRNLTGDVTDKAGNKVKGAVVHLKDTRSLAQRSYITADDGAFRFGALSSNSDYEVWADLGDRKSASKSISSFDSKKDIEFSLKMP